jgi:hypothetical protein
MNATPAKLKRSRGDYNGKNERPLKLFLVYLVI